MKCVFKYILLSLGVLSLSACEDYLSETPTKGTNQPVKSLEQLEGLLNNPTCWEMNMAAPYSTDDYEIKTELYDAAVAKASIFSMDVLHHYTFKNEEVASTVTDYLWSSLYSTIYNANLILENVDNVEGDAVLKARIKAEAYFLRAYTNWMIANFYCLPYCTANLQELGLPLRKTTDMTENLTRATLEDTYQFIEADLAEALKIDLVEPEYTWRASKATIQAFLSRYYMHKGEYEKAVEAADYALDHSGIAKLKDYNSLGVGLSVIPGLLEFPETAMYSIAQAVSWGEFFYARMNRIVSGWYVPSTGLVGLYDQENDMRYKRFFTYNGLIFLEPGFMALGYNMFFFGATQIPSGPSVPEVMLNKAECLLRQANPNVEGALSVANELRAHRMVPGASGIDLEAGTKEEALKKILEERRRELPFSHRWLDLRRFGVNETSLDDVDVVRTFYSLRNGTVDKSKIETYMLPAKSRRYAVPINEGDISASQGVIKQNTY